MRFDSINVHVIVQTAPLPAGAFIRLSRHGG
jgi:hypothetical protein